MAVTPIKNHNGESYRESHIQDKPKVDRLLKAGFDKFFIVRVEDLIRLMKLPVPPARVQNHTLIYLTAGEAVMTIGSEKHTIFKDECLVVPAGQVFSFDNVDINTGYLCNFHNDFIVGKFGRPERLNEFDFLRVWAKPRIRLDSRTAQWAGQLMDRLLVGYSESGLTQPNLIQAYLMALLCEIDRMYEPVPASPQTNAVTLTDRFKELLFATLKTNHRVSDYASLLSITPNHLNKSVKAVTGKSPTRWIDEAIVLEAKMLLYQSSLSISEVAAEIGLFDPSYFSRLFKKYEGMTPRQFRQMIETS